MSTTSAASRSAGTAGADPAVRSRQCHADPLQRPTQAQGPGLRDRQAINDAEGAHRPGSPPRNHHARCLETELSSRRLRRFRPISLRTGGRIELPQGATPEGGSKTTARIVLQRPTPGRLRLQPSRPAPSLPHQAPNERAENTGIPKASKPGKSIYKPRRGLNDISVLSNSRYGRSLSASRAVNLANA